MYKNIAPFIVSSFLIYQPSCNTGPVATEGKKQANSETRDFRKDIPLRANGDTSIDYLDAKKEQERLGISSLENGVDSLEIRLWAVYAYNDTSQIITIRKEKSSWKSELLTLHYLSDQNVNKSIKSIVPKSGWSQLIDTLMHLSIMTLPSHESVPEAYFDADVDYLIVQTATKNSYRFYSYPWPAPQHRGVKEVEKIKSILQVLDSELEFKRVTTPYNQK